MKKIILPAFLIICLTGLLGCNSVKEYIEPTPETKVDVDPTETKVDADPRPVEGDFISYARFSLCDEETMESEDISLFYGASGAPSYVVSYQKTNETVVDNIKVSSETGDKLSAAIIEYFKNYNTNGSYWPDSEEYPAMLVLFDFAMDIERDGQVHTFKGDGATGIPVGYENFFREMVEIINADDAFAPNIITPLDREIEAYNREVIENALGDEMNETLVKTTLDCLTTLETGKLQSAEKGMENDQKVLTIVSSDGTRYMIYHSGSGGAVAVENLDTGEWPIFSEE